MYVTYAKKKFHSDENENDENDKNKKTMIKIKITEKLKTIVITLESLEVLLIIIVI